MTWVEPEDAKVRKPIGLPLSDYAVEVLRGQIGQDEEWVFSYKSKGRKAGKPIVKIKTSWQKALEHAGLGQEVISEGPDGKNHRKWVSSPEPSSRSMTASSVVHALPHLLASLDFPET